ncbi:hypothetical protein Mapa_003176 [Marchantia paleacea]|nr:hypothetical protein Mapa_003176 [Marchantia paleacea]
MVFCEAAGVPGLAFLAVVHHRTTVHIFEAFPMLSMVPLLVGLEEMKMEASKLSSKHLSHRCCNFSRRQSGCGERNKIPGWLCGRGSCPYGCAYGADPMMNKGGGLTPCSGREGLSPPAWVCRC